MTPVSPKLFILPFPQSLAVGDQAVLTCNLLVMPRFSPLDTLHTDPVAGDFPAFATGALRLKPALFAGDTQGAPKPGDIPVAVTMLPDTIVRTDDRTDAFNTIDSLFEIKDGANRTFSEGSIYKYLSTQYRNAFNFTQPATPFAKTDDSYFCMLQQSTAGAGPFVPNNEINWAQALAFCLQHPQLAEQLGILYRGIQITHDDPAFFAAGGWLYFDFEAADGDTTYDKLPVDEVLRYAAYIPATTNTRHLFAPVLFPVVAGATQPFDGAFRDLVRYDDGFAKIVHASQAISANELAEQYDGNPPVMDTGIRLGWDEEQLLIWLNNSMQAKAGANPVPAPVSGIGRYRVDAAVKEGEPAATDEDDLDWKSLVAVEAAAVNIDAIALDAFTGDLGVEVAPVKHGGSKDYWLPVYFANWNGHPLCVKDVLDETIRQSEQHAEGLKASLALPPPARQPENIYAPAADDALSLQYGNRYAFRVRLSDLTGGGPAKTNNSLNTGAHKIAYCDFQRHVAPQPPVLLISAADKLTIGRARLNYPAITFTRQDRNAVVAALQDDINALDDIYVQIKEVQANDPGNTAEVHRLLTTLRAPGLPDPDIDKIQIVVEVKSLDMDVEGSYHARNGIAPKESYIHLYTTTRDYPAYQLSHAPIDDLIELDLAFRDIPVINFNEDASLLGFAEDVLAGNGSLILPTGREVRLSIRSCCSEQADDYFAHEHYRYSTTLKATVRKDPAMPEPLPILRTPAGSDRLVSFYFRPVNKPAAQEYAAAAAAGKGAQLDIDIMERLAAESGLACRDLSVSGKENIRTQFGCSRLLGHTLSPDASSITFAGKQDLLFKWINVLQFDLQRDWTWDLLQPVAVKVFRRWGFEAGALGERELAGTITLSKGLNWQKMQGPDRSFTRLVFIDALDPKQGANTLPDKVVVEYFMEPQWIDTMPPSAEHAVPDASNTLPITIPPRQVPEIVAVGLAMTPEEDEQTLFNNQYSETAARRSYLWIEFARPIEDPNDTYFARVLAYAADPMLADLATNPQPGREMPEPEINLDAEIVRAIREGQTEDQSGLEAMQQMTPALAAAGKPTVHFLLPLPEGLTPESMELFGFFTYEIRLGHLKKWSTAQARFGRPLRMTGIQHPAPPMQVHTLRDNDAVLISTSFAQSYQDGKDCTPLQPRTDIFGLLYAQVLQADGSQYRNILISKQVLLKPQYVREAARREALQKVQQQAHRVIAGPVEPYALAPGDVPKANTFWRMKDIRRILLHMGIDVNAPLSVLVVELMPPNNHPDFITARHIEPGLLATHNPGLALDQARILRTSRLVKIADVCAV